MGGHPYDTAQVAERLRPYEHITRDAVFTAARIDKHHRNTQEAVTASTERPVRALPNHTTRLLNHTKGVIAL